MSDVYIQHADEWSTALFDVSHGYDPVCNRLWTQDNLRAERDELYTYDNLSRTPPPAFAFTENRNLKTKTENPAILFAVARILSLTHPCGIPIPFPQDFTTNPPFAHPEP